MGSKSKLALAAALCALCAGVCANETAVALNVHDCGPGLPAAVVVGGERQKAQACEGLRRAVAFMEANGRSPEKNGVPIVYKFPKAIMLPCESPGCEPIRVAGMYEAETKTVSATDSDEPWMHAPERLYFGLPYEEEMYISVLAHESTHALDKEFYRAKEGPACHALDEYMAYASQLWSMDPALRERVLALYPERRYEFKSEGQVNDMVHFMAPHGFGAMSYRHYLASGKGPMDRMFDGIFGCAQIE